MNIIAHNNKINTTVVLPLLEPVPIYREEVRWGRPCEGGVGVYIACLMLNLDANEINTEFAIGPKGYTNSNANSDVNARLYPNPAQNEVYVEFNHSINGNAVLEIYGFAGNLIQATEIANNTQIVNISTKTLKNGIYFYRILYNNSVLAKDKLVIYK